MAKADERLFTIKIDAPTIRKGRIPVPMLLKVCEKAQKAVATQAKTIEGKDPVVLELVGLRKGSTQLDFAEAPPDQLAFGYMHDFPPVAFEAVEEIASALISANRRQKQWAEAVTPEAIEALDGMGEVFDSGVTSLKWIIQPRQGKKRRTINVGLNTQKYIRERKRELLRRLTPPQQPSLKCDLAFEGLLEMADGKCRIARIGGEPVMITFNADQASKVFEAWHKPVRVRVDPQTKKLVDISVSEEDSMDRGSFFAAKSINELIAEQNTCPVADLNAWGDDISADEVEAFVSGLYADREPLE